MTSAKTPPFRNREGFYAFVREVCPSADEASILLFAALHRTSANLMQHTEQDLEQATGLTWPKYRLLLLLLHAEHSGQTDGILPSILSERQSIGRNTASALIRGLEDKGLVTRALDAADRRKFLIRLTPNGRRIVREQMGNHFRKLSTLFSTLSPDERAQLLDLLNRVAAGLAR